MTLGTDTAALLRCGIDALLQLIGSAPYALLGPDERKSALRHLTVTAEAAARLAEVAHVDALRAQHAVLSGPARGGDTEALITTKATTTESSGGGEEVLVQKQGAGLEKLKSEKQMAETETLVLGVDTSAEEIERLVGEKERVEAEVESVREQLERLVAESGKQKRELHSWRIARSIAEEQREDISKDIAEAGEKLKAMANGRSTVKEIDSLIQYLSCLGGSDWRLYLEEDSMRTAELQAELKLNRSVQETEDLQEELERTRTSVASLRERRELISSEQLKAREKLKAEANGRGREIDIEISYLYTLGMNDCRVLTQRDSAKEEVDRLWKDLERSALEAKKLREEVNRLNNEKAKVEADLKWRGAGSGAGGGAGPVKKGERRGLYAR